MQVMPLIRVECVAIKNIGGGKYLSPDNPAYNNRLFGLVYFVCIIHDAKLVSLASLVFENDKQS